ncbi:MAG: hypothetical protein ABI330_18770 [Caldimonas sp.]
MSNLTITIDDALLRTARVKAVQEGTSVNEICRQAIAAYARQSDADAVARAQAKAEAFLNHALSVKLGPGTGRRLSRDEEYELILSERSPGGFRK